MNIVDDRERRPVGFKALLWEVVSPGVVKLRRSKPLAKCAFHSDVERAVL